MKLTEKPVDKWDDRTYWSGRANNIKFEIRPNLSRLRRPKGGDGKNWYVKAYTAKDDKVFNSLWEGIRFESVEEAHDWCLNFRFEDYPDRPSGNPGN